MSRNSAGNSSSSPTTQVPIVGRDTFLARLHTALVEHGIVVVSGVSGIGKTTAVREYSHRFAPQYQTILWLNAAPTMKHSWLMLFLPCKHIRDQLTWNRE